MNVNVSYPVCNPNVQSCDPELLEPNQNLTTSEISVCPPGTMFVPEGEYKIPAILISGTNILGPHFSAYYKLVKGFCVDRHVRTNTIVHETPKELRGFHGVSYEDASQACEKLGGELMSYVQYVARAAMLGAALFDEHSGSEWIQAEYGGIFYLDYLQAHAVRDAQLQGDTLPEGLKKYCDAPKFERAGSSSRKLVATWQKLICDERNELINDVKTAGPFAHVEFDLDSLFLKTQLAAGPHKFYWHRPYEEEIFGIYRVQRNSGLAVLSTKQVFRCAYSPMRGTFPVF